MCERQRERGREGRGRKEGEGKEKKERGREGGKEGRERVFVSGCHSIIRSEGGVSPMGAGSRTEVLHQKGQLLLFITEHLSRPSFCF